MVVCPMASPATPPVPHVGGPIVTGAPTVLVCGLPAARISDQNICVGPPGFVAMGSLTCLIASKPAARLGDMAGHGGKILSGAPTVLIG
jgi:uncharacterized Zn-binding protein involved in type VI secretion